TLSEQGGSIFITAASADFQGSQNFIGSTQISTNPNSTIQIENNVAVTSTGNISLSSGTILNNGTLSTTTGTINLNNTLALQVIGTGSIATLDGVSQILMGSGNNALTVTQNSISGALNISGSSISVTTSTGGLTIKNALASNGSVSFLT